jgi:transcriptional regulator with XRE-family HTH domain
MDQRDEIRDFLASRRARITPQQAGLPTYGANRRVPGLRREEVALLAGVSVDYYTQLERGNRGGVSDSVLHALAGALQLDEAERAHLFALARITTTTPARPRRPPGPQRVRPSIQRLLDAMTGVPAYVRTGRSEAFRGRWAAHNVRLHRSGHKQLHHPVAGDLELTYEALELPAGAGLTMITYTAQPGSPSQDALDFLASWAATLERLDQPATAQAPDQA